MRLYHFVNKKFGLEDLTKKRLKVATFEDLNDPFELLGPSSKDERIRHAFLRLRTDLSKFSGMLCFSRGWKNPVQWSHYADGHRGLCLGFDVPDAKAISVTYSRRRFEPNLTAINNGGAEGQAEMFKVLSTKYSHWRYENEVRFFVELDEVDPQTGLYFVPFSAELQLREIIVGHRSDVGRSDLAAALGRYHGELSMHKARIAFRSFRVVRQRKESLWT